MSKKNGSIYNEKHPQHLDENTHQKSFAWVLTPHFTSVF